MHQIVHRDLKPPNLLLSFATEERLGLPRVMISDFGECEVLSEEQASKRSGATGTLEFMPPEMLQKDSRGNYIPNHSVSVDLWSLGVVLYFLCYSKVPYSQTEDVDALKQEILAFDSSKMVFEEYPRVDPQYHSLIRSLLSFDASLRPSVAVVMDVLGKMRQEKSPYNVYTPDESIGSEARLEELPLSGPTDAVALASETMLDPSMVPIDQLLSKRSLQVVSQLDRHYTVQQVLLASVHFLPLVPSLLFAEPRPFLVLASCLSVYWIQLQSRQPSVHHQLLLFSLFVLLLAMGMT
ncbi:hypothetical protein HDU91_003946 [Kappamyces sp. JEL0680]|nr:hypothetical protein HDU91_003946 [Kappamyces sp. JEL0680]